MGATAQRAVHALAIPVAPARFATSPASLQKLPPLEHAPRSIDAVDPWTGSPLALAPLEGSLHRQAVARPIRHIDTTDPWTPQIDYAPIDDELPGETASADAPSPSGS